MIPWIVIILFLLTGLLAGLRFVKKKDPFGGLDAESRESVEDPGNDK